MATRRDQLHSYQFMTQRVISAFVMRETDPQQSPLRRGVGAVFGGIMVAILVAAGFGIYGIITKTGVDRWKTDGAVVIEKETGASFVYFRGVLTPTLNFASAVLVAGRADQVFRVSSKSLGEAPRGTTVGIPGAPDSLPTVKNQVGLPWTVCTTPGSDSSGNPISTVTLAVATRPTGARALGDEGLLVRDRELDQTFLVWRGHRYQIQSPDQLVPALFGATTAVVPAGTAWVNSLAAGAEIGRIPIDDRGTPSSAVSGQAIGNVLTAQTGSGPQHYLVFDDGVAPISPLQLAILVGEYDVDPDEVPISQVNSVPTSSRLRPAQGETAPPQTVPALFQAGSGEQLCAVTSDARGLASVEVGGTVAGLDTATRTGSATSGGVPLADRVLAPAGKVAVVRVLGSPTAEAGPYYVITDLGIRYAVPSDQVLTALGYPPQQAVDVPAGLVSRIPAGPTLDPARAILPATSSQPS